MAKRIISTLALAGMTGLAGCVNNGNVNVFGIGNKQEVGPGSTKRSYEDHSARGECAQSTQRYDCARETVPNQAPSVLTGCNEPGISDYFSVPRIFTCNSFSGDSNGNGILDAGDIQGYKRMFGLDEPLTVVAWAPTNKPVWLQIYDSRGCKRFDEAYVNGGSGVQLPLCRARELGPGHYRATMQLDNCGQGQWYKAADWSFDVDP